MIGAYMNEDLIHEFLALNKTEALQKKTINLFLIMIKNQL